jgi:hypothetical protein
MHLYEDKNDMLIHIIKDYIKSNDEEDNRTRHPLIIFCYRADYSLLLLFTLIQVAEEWFGPSAVDRVKGI